MTFTARFNKPRRVLHVITPSHLSGAETQLVRMATRMEQRGHAMPALVKSGFSAIDELRRRGLTCVTAKISGKLNPLAIPRIAAVARQQRAEVLQSALSTASWWCGWLERFGGPPSIGHVHGFTSARWHAQQTHLLAVSGPIRDHLVSQGISAEKVTVLHNALAPEEFQPTRSVADVRAEMGADLDAPVIGAFGHLSVKKGHRDLFRAIPRVLEQIPDAQFWIVGRGALHEELAAAARDGGFLDHVRFTGFRRDAADLMNAIDVMALPSHREPFALVYIEAAILGKPVVGCRAGGAVESIADGETGLLTPVGDDIAIAEAITTLLDDKTKATQFGRRGRERVLEEFTWERFAATLEGVYERVLDESASMRFNGRAA